MRRTSVAVGLLSLLIIGLAFPAGAAAPKTSFALSGEARALEVALGDQGLTLGVTAVRADSTPKVAGIAAGQCALLGESADPDGLPCNESTQESSRYPGNIGDPNFKCAGPAIPAPLNSILTLDIACGASTSNVVGGLPTSSNDAKVAEAALELDVAGAIPEVEAVKEQLVDELQKIIGQAPEPIKTALNQIADTVDDGQAAKIKLGPATTRVSSVGKAVQVQSTAAGAVIGVLGLPDIAKNGQPILGTSSATEDGLIIVEIGKATATASLERGTAKATSSATAALVTVKVRDITKPTPSYVQIDVAPGQTVTVLEGTPLESTITAANAATDNKGSEARAAADAVRVHLAKGVQGGVKAGFGRATAAAKGAATLPTKPIARPAPPKVLPVTGGVDRTGLSIGLLVAAGALFLVRKRFVR